MQPMIQTLAYYFTRYLKSPREVEGLLLEPCSSCSSCR